MPRSIRAIGPRDPDALPCPTKTGPPDISSHGVAALKSASSTGSPSRREDERIGDEALAVVAEAAADSVGADAREAKAGAVAAAAAAAERLEPHAAVAARVGHARSDEVAHRVARALLERDAEDVVRALAAAEGLQEARLRDERLVVHLAFGARVAARRGPRAGLALGAHVA